ncbi:MAG: 7-carboxy-7-deazaguanine synthase QueE [Desulfobacteraceae bacterium]|nr:7-carboxy-7-deazaguanine synthase QueE [Desulfobacteraceae bacterium]
MLDVAEIFTSIQGEGPLMGQPAVFLRLAGCVQPHCCWCDTPEALEPGRKVPWEKVRDNILALKPDLVIITGGEPFFQWKTGLDKLTRALLTAGRRIQFETSAKAGIAPDTGAMIVCSPKPINAPFLAPNLADRVDAFKFVIRNNIEPVLDFQQKHGICSERIWLMALGANRSQQLNRMNQVWKLCVIHGFQFSPRLHILAFNQQKGI